MTSELMLIKSDYPELDQIRAHRRGLLAKLEQMVARLDGVGEQEDGATLLEMAATELLMMGQALELTYTRETRLMEKMSQQSSSTPPVSPLPLVAVFVNPTDETKPIKMPEQQNGKVSKTIQAEDDA